MIGKLLVMVEEIKELQLEQALESWGYIKFLSSFLITIVYLVCSGAEIAGEVIETGEEVEQLSKVTVCSSSLDPK